VFLFAVVAVGIIFHAKAVAQTASDQSAIAGARSLSCSRARQAALENGAELVSCQLIGSDVQVEVNVPTGVVFASSAVASSRAGPADCG
jgi:secretion/DNA translocation related TadE-like protein